MKNRLKGEVFIGNVAEKVEEIIPVHSVGPAEIGLGGVEFLKIKILSVAEGTRTRQDDFQSVVETISVAQTPLIRVITGGLPRNLDAFEIASPFGDHIDHAKKRVAAIQGGTGTSDDFNPVDEVDVHGKFGADEGLIEDAVIDAVTVDQEEDACVEVARPRKTSDAGIFIDSIVSDEKAALALKHIGESTISILFDFTAGDDVYRRGSFIDFLFILGHSENRGDVLEKEHFLALALELGTSVVRIHTRKGPEAEHQQSQRKTEVPGASFPGSRVCPDQFEHSHLHPQNL